LKKSEKEWIKKLVDFGCVVCRKFYDDAITPPCIHHIREGMGKSQRNNWDNCLPLCHEHHQGNDGFHSGKRTWIDKYGTEYELLEWLKERL